jgi:hypothetical protein
MKMIDQKFRGRCRYRVCSLPVSPSRRKRSRAEGVPYGCYYIVDKTTNKPIPPFYVDLGDGSWRSAFVTRQKAWEFLRTYEAEDSEEIRAAKYQKDVRLAIMAQARLSVMPLGTVIQ